jgi:RNA polymerase primary sigma factor
VKYTFSGGYAKLAIQEGNVGLTRAIETFDVRRGFRVTTHVTWWIRQAITHALAKHSSTIHIPEHMQTHVRRLALLQDTPTSANGQASSVVEIAHALGMNEKKAKQVRDVSHYIILSLQAPSDARHTTDTTWKVSCNPLNFRKQFAEGFFRAVFISP